MLTPIFTYLRPANFDAFSEPEKVFSQLTTQPSPAALQQLTATIARRLTPQPIKLRADIELTCYTDAGIDAIKKALKAGEAVSTEAVPIKAKLVAPPLYVLGTNATDKVDRTSSHAYLHTKFTLTLATYSCIVRSYGEARTRYRDYPKRHRGRGWPPNCQDEGA